MVEQTQELLVMMKDLKKFEAGKRLAEYNHREKSLQGCPKLRVKLIYS